MQLSKRLQMVASFVTPGNRLADIGTDHGYIPIFLVQKGIIPFAIASDINRGPLLRAGEHIAQSGLGKNIQTRLGDGLSPIAPGEADTILIAGMGGPLMTDILEAGKAVWTSASELVLSPHSDVPRVRTYIMQNGFSIVQEEMVKEEGKYYVGMRAVPASRTGPGGTEETERWTEEEICFGKLLLQKRHPVLREYLLRVQQKTEQILQGLEGKEGEGAALRRAQLAKEAERIQKALSCCAQKGGKTDEVQ